MGMGKNLDFSGISHRLKVRHMLKYLTDLEPELQTRLYLLCQTAIPFPKQSATGQMLGNIDEFHLNSCPLFLEILIPQSFPLLLLSVTAAMIIVFFCKVFNIVIFGLECVIFSTKTAKSTIFIC